MNSAFRLKGLSFLLLSTALTTACNPAGMTIAPGKYKGSLVRKSDGELKEILVTAELAQSDSGSLSLTIKDEQDKAIDHGTLAANQLNQIDVSITSIGLKNTQLTMQGDCFVGGKAPLVRVCQDPEHMLIEAGSLQSVDYSLSLAPLSQFSQPVETPATYTLDQARTRSKSGSASGRPAFRDSAGNPGASKIHGA